MQVFEQKGSKAVNSEVSPLVSVVITNYNYAAFLDCSITSVLEQTYRNFELIVVDDGSTDNSREVIEAYGDRVSAIFQANAGMGASRTAGLVKSKGEIICFLDADDYFHPEKLSKVVAAFAEHPEWVLVSHCWTSVNKAGEPRGSGASDVLSQGDVRNLLLKWGKYASGITSASAYRRSALEQVLPMSGDFGIDTYMNASLPFYGAVGSINEPLMFYRIHGNNIRAHSDNLPRLLRQREATADFINHMAAKVGLPDRFDLQRDVDYRVYKAIEKGGAAFTETLTIIWLSLQESIAIGRSPKDTVIRLLSRAICTMPGQGSLVLRYGLLGYLRFKVLGQQPKK